MSSRQDIIAQASAGSESARPSTNWANQSAVGAYASLPRPHDAAPVRSSPRVCWPQSRRGLPHPESRGPGPPARRLTAPADRTADFKEYDLGFVHVDVKHLPKLRTSNGESRKRYLYVAIDRASRFVHLAVKDDETERSAVAFLKEAVQAFPFQVTHVLTDRGSCFTADGFEAACQKLGVEHRKTRPYTPRTNGMVERFNGRIQREVLGITVASHRDLETLLRGFNQAYNARRQRVLKGRSPDMVVHERLSAAAARANRGHDPPFDPCILPKALQVISLAKDVSHPDS